MGGTRTITPNIQHCTEVCGHSGSVYWSAFSGMSEFSGFGELFAEGSLRTLPRLHPRLRGRTEGVLTAKVLPASRGAYGTLARIAVHPGASMPIEECAALVGLLDEPVAHARLWFGMGQEQPDAAVQSIQIARVEIDRSIVPQCSPTLPSMVVDG